MISCNQLPTKRKAGLLKAPYSMSKIAIDIDDVLAANAEGFVAFSNERWGTNLTVEDYDEHWSKMWGVDLEETERRSSEFHVSGAVAGYAHHEAAIPVLRQLAGHHELVVVTSRRKSIQAETLEWLQSRYGTLFSEIHFAGIWDIITDHSHTLTKADVCQAIGADYLIDDQLKHCVAVANVGITALLFGNYQWNQADTLPDNVIRCHDWEAVQEYFQNHE